jgi:hypothetical protein
MISSSLVLVTLYFYLYPPPDGSRTLPFAHILVDILPYVYARILRWVSPLFTLLEGISTLLVVQVAGRVGKGWADEEEREEGVEWRSLAGLVLAALVYCAGLAGVTMVSVSPGSLTSGLSVVFLVARVSARCGHERSGLFVVDWIFATKDECARDEFGLCLRRVFRLAIRGGGDYGVSLQRFWGDVH